MTVLGEVGGAMVPWLMVSCVRRSTYIYKLAVLAVVVLVYGSGGGGDGSAAAAAAESVMLPL